MNSSFLLRPELSLCMRSSFHSNLIRLFSNCKTNIQPILSITKLGSKIFKLSFNLNLKTSCHLPSYYSLELNLISSTSDWIPIQKTPAPDPRDLHDLLRRQGEIAFERCPGAHLRHFRRIFRNFENFLKSVDFEVSGSLKSSFSTDFHIYRWF